VKRQLLGRASGAVSRQRVYRIADGLEVDDIDHYEVSRRRVYFDEVTAITYHAQRGWIVAVILSLLALALFAVALMIGSSEVIAATIFGVLGGMLAIPAVIKLLVPARIVTVFGKRTKAVMRFALRHERARSTYEELVGEIHRRQEALRLEAEGMPSSSEAFPLPVERE
jgi:hypothetical protein